MKKHYMHEILCGFAVNKLHTVHFSQMYEQSKSHKLKRVPLTFISSSLPASRLITETEQTYTLQYNKRRAFNGSSVFFCFFLMHNKDNNILST